MGIPFRIGQRVTGEFFTDRVDEVARIRDAIRSEGRLLVYGERRQGKTSAIEQAARRVRKGGGLVLGADVATAGDLGEVARRLVAGVPWKWRWRDELQSALTRARLVVESRVDATGSLSLHLGLAKRPMDPGHGLDELRRVLAIVDDLAGREGAGPVAVVLDEFQDITRLVDRGDWLLRDLIQTSEHMAFVCAGSRRRVIDTLLAKDGAFHRFFEPLTFGPMDAEHLATWIESRLRGAGVACDSGVGARVLELAGDRTEDCVRLARALFLERMGSANATATDVDGALAVAALEDHDRYHRLWGDLPRSQQAVLRAIAAGETAVYGADARSDFGLTSPGTVRTAVMALQDRALLVEDAEPRIDDPYFREWIRLRAMT
jgi:hypothetical protein